MSKGLGRIERGILSFLKGQTFAQDTFEIAVAVFDIKPDDDGFSRVSKSHRVSVLRALASLSRRGLVERLYRGHNKRAYWSLPDAAVQPANMSNVEMARRLNCSPSTVARARTEARRKHGDD